MRGCRDERHATRHVILSAAKDLTADARSFTSFRMTRPPSLFSPCHPLILSSPQNSMRHRDLRREFGALAADSAQFLVIRAADGGAVDEGGGRRHVRFLQAARGQGPRAE